MPLRLRVRSPPDPLPVTTMTAAMPSRWSSPGNFWGPFNLGGLVVITAISLACYFVCMLLLVWLLFRYGDRLAEVLVEREEYADRLNELHRENENIRQQNGRLEELEKWLRGEIELKMRRIRESQTNLEQANEKIAEDEKRISKLEKDLSSLRARYESTMTGLAELSRLIK